MALNTSSLSERVFWYPEKRNFWFCISRIYLFEHEGQHEDVAQTAFIIDYQ